MNKSYKALKDDVLDKINGGVVLDTVLENADTTVAFYKLLGVKEFEEFKKILINSYKDDPSLYSTDGSDKDLQDIIKTFEEAWNK